MTPRQLLAILIALLVLAPVAVAKDGEEEDDERPDTDEAPSGDPPDRDANATNESASNRSGSSAGDEDSDEEGTSDQGRGRGRGGDSEREAERADDDEDDDGDDDHRRPAWTPAAADRKGRDVAAAARSVKDAVGRFQVAEDARDVTGTYVAFAFNESSVTGVTVQGLPVFNAFATGNADADDDALEIRSRGAEIRIEAPLYELRAHDNPGAVFKFDDGGAWTFVFPAGTNLSMDGERLRVTYPTGERAHVLSGAGWAVNGTSASTGEDAVFVLHAAKGSFDKHRDEIAEAIGKRHVGAEVTVVRAPGEDAGDADAVTFGNVTVDTLAKHGNVTFIVEGHGFDGRVLVMNVDPALFEASTADELTVLFDNGSIARASSLLDVLDPDDDGLAPEYWIVEDENGYQVIFSVPHYSVHTMSLLDTFKEVPPSVAVGLVASVIVVAAGGFVLFRGPRGRA